MQVQLYQLEPIKDMNAEILRSTELIKYAVEDEIKDDALLVPETGVYMQTLTEEYVEPLAAHYSSAYDRGDFFASRYSDPRSEIFNPNWLKGQIYSSKNTWILFTDAKGDLLGSTGLFHENGQISIDETQIDPKGRGKKIMAHYFRRMVPLLEALGLDIETEFVLTRESKGLRLTLQKELGMAVLGIHPNILFHRTLEETATETSAAKYTRLQPNQATILPQFYPLFSIVAQQLDLPKPEIIETNVRISGTPFASQYSEVYVDAAKPEEQKIALEEGYQPVRYDPKRHVFSVARFPSEKPNLDFIAEEGIEPNTKLVNYLDKNLYKQGEVHDKAA